MGDTPPPAAAPARSPLAELGWGALWIVVIIFTVIFTLKLAAWLGLINAPGFAPGFQNAPAAVGSTIPSGMTNHGPNAICKGKPKYTTFRCISPGTGRETDCMCD